ncbi:unnamed protein product [Linum tenue]|uniref:CCHC-type domain-containing protein n=1 Tax=Linum tenue TaxID=586396 RepID=A0AAV0HCG0_9ROSI|nr:unnamed protein product [Linum tenue]
MEIIDLNNDTFLATFGEDQDYLKVLTGGPWVILDHYLIVHQCSSSFRTSDKPHRSVVAWVQLPELPVHFYHREILFALGNLIGRTIKIDYHTEHLERGKFARIAIELDMTKPLPTRIWLDNFWQAVLYENLPTICYHCGRIGHQEDNCPQVRQETPLAITGFLEAEQAVSPATSSQDPPAGFGPWMQVIRKSCKPSRKVSEHVTQNRQQIRGESGKSSASAKGKSEDTLAKGSREGKGKGKVEQSSGNKKGTSASQKTASAKEEDGLNGKKKAQVIKEWRPIDSREPKTGQDIGLNEDMPTLKSLEASSSGTKEIVVTQR